VRWKGVHGAAAVLQHTAHISREPSLRKACESPKCECDHLLIDLHISMPPDPAVVWNILHKRKNSVTANLFSLRNIPVECDQRWKPHLRHARYSISLLSSEQNDSPKHSLIILILLCLHIGCWQVHSILPTVLLQRKMVFILPPLPVRRMPLQTWWSYWDLSWQVIYYVMLTEPAPASSTKLQVGLEIRKTSCWLLLFFTVYGCLHQLCDVQEHFEAMYM